MRVSIIIHHYNWSLIWWYYIFSSAMSPHNNKTDNNLQNRYVSTLHTPITLLAGWNFSPKPQPWLSYGMSWGSEVNRFPQQITSSHLNTWHCPGSSLIHFTCIEVAHLDLSCSVNSQGGATLMQAKRIKLDLALSRVVSSSLYLQRP